MILTDIGAEINKKGSNLEPLFLVLLKLSVQELLSPTLEAFCVRGW
jgi:hypothetical protein